MRTEVFAHFKDNTFLSNPVEGWIVLEERAKEAISTCLIMLASIRLDEFQLFVDPRQKRVNKTLDLLDLEVRQLRNSEIKKPFASIANLLSGFRSLSAGNSTLEFEKLLEHAKKANALLANPLLEIPAEYQFIEDTCSIGSHSHIDENPHLHPHSHFNENGKNEH